MLTVIGAASISGYGHIYLLATLAKQSGLKACLEHVFGPEITKDILSLVYFGITEAKALHFYPLWRESCACNMLSELSSQKISELLRIIADSGEEIQEFFSTFAGHHGPITGAWLDITSISSYSKNDSFFEYGYNRDGETMPQINIGVLMGFPMHLPIMYEVYPGSINDVTTLHNIAIKTQKINIPIESWVMDRGFFSTANIDHMIQNNFKFVIGLPGNLKECARLMQTNIPTTSLNVFKSGKHLLSYVEEICTVGKHLLRAVVYFQHKRYVLEYTALLERVIDLENFIIDNKFSSLEKLQLLISEQVKLQLPASCLLFTIANGHIVAERNDEHIMLLLHGKGKFILITNQHDLLPELLLSQY